MQLASVVPVQVVRNMCVAGSPCSLSRCPSLREASLRLQCASSQVGDVLAQLPPSLESLTVHIAVGNLPVRASAVGTPIQCQLLGSVTRSRVTCMGGLCIA